MNVLGAIILVGALAVIFLKRDSIFSKKAEGGSDDWDDVSANDE